MLLRISLKNSGFSLIIFLSLILLIQNHFCDGFKLRDFKAVATEKFGVNNLGNREFKENPFTKIERIYHANDNEYQDADIDEEIDDDDDDDNYVNDDDNEDDDEDDDDDDEDDDDDDNDFNIEIDEDNEAEQKESDENNIDEKSNEINVENDGNKEQNDDYDETKSNKYVFQKVRRRPNAHFPERLRNFEKTSYREMNKNGENNNELDDKFESKSWQAPEIISTFLGFFHKKTKEVSKQIQNKKKSFFEWWEKEQQYEDNDKISNDNLEKQLKNTEVTKKEDYEEGHGSEEPTSWFSKLYKKISEFKLINEDEQRDEQKLSTSYKSTSKEKITKTQNTIILPKQPEEINKPQTRFPKSIPFAPQPVIKLHPPGSEIKNDAQQFLSFIKEKSSTILNIITTNETDEEKEKKIIQKVVEEKEPIESDTAKKSSKKTKKSKSLLEFDELLLTLPSFVPNYTNIHNINCKSQGQIFQRQLNGQKHWALQMMDASAKIPAGLMRGNVNQLGDFDLCTDIASKIKITDEKSIRMRGKYCLAQVDIIAVANDLKLPVYLMQGRGFLRSSLKDPSHFIPRFTTFNWGICLPAGCTHGDAEKIINDGIRQYNSTGIKIHVEVNEDNCYVKYRTDYIKLIKTNWQTVGSLAYYTFVFVLVILASMNDYWIDWKNNINTSKENKDNNKQTNEVKENESYEDNLGVINQVLMSFSIKRTIKELLDCNNENNDKIECINGIKAIGTVALYFALKLIPLARVPFTNRIYFTEYFNSPFSIFIRAAFLYTDIFLLVSGILTAYRMSRDFEVHGKILWIKRLLGRFIRLTPALLATLLFYAWIWEHIGLGPQWGDVVKKNADICKENLWANLFHIQNWFPFEEICATQTYQLGIDMQFYLISPLIVWLLHSIPVIGMGAFGILHGISAAMRYSSTLSNRLSPVIFHGMKLSQFYRTADLSFAAPLHRATPYFTGIGLGFILSQVGQNIKLPKGVVIVGWISSLWGIVWCFWTPSHLALKNYQYDPNEAAAYSAWASLVWSISICWIVFVCFTGNGNKLNKILRSRLMIVLNKISYSIFLIEFLVFFWKTGTIRTSQQFQLSTSLFDWNEIAITLGSAVVMTLTFDLPFQKIRSIILSNSQEKPNNKTDKDKSANLNAMERITNLIGDSIKRNPDSNIDQMEVTNKNKDMEKDKEKFTSNPETFDASYNNFNKSQAQASIKGICDGDEKRCFERETKKMEPSDIWDKEIENEDSNEFESEQEDEDEDEEEEEIDDSQHDDVEYEDDEDEFEVKPRPITNLRKFEWNIHDD